MGQGSGRQVTNWVFGVVSEATAWMQAAQFLSVPSEYGVGALNNADYQL